VERARSGFGRGRKICERHRAGQGPCDGYFATFWRILLEYPEVLAWANLWVTSRHEFEAALYRKVNRSIPRCRRLARLAKPVRSAPFQRAEENYTVMTSFSDFLRPALYNNVPANGSRVCWLRADSVLAICRRAGARTALPAIELPGGTFDKVAATGLSRIMSNGRLGVPSKMWRARQPKSGGVDIDVPSGGLGHCTPESVGQAVKAVFHGGAKASFSRALH